ncbi:MAG TPA: FtsX-like permease family protein [Streptosporangiaceae bacterium]|nr:FtsX-like permease family protein [Streptosporangiaceae bacterium]
MTAVLDRPTETGGGGGAAARRAVMRWAWRLFRREWRQQLLVLTLITVAVAATIFGAAIGTNAPLPANGGFGSANTLVNLPGSDPRLAADVAAIRAHFGPVDVIENQTFATGLVQGAQLRAQNPDGAFGRPMLALVSGHYPHGAGQVAMSGPLASTYRVGIGGIWRSGGRAWRVVGLAENPQNLLDDFALVAPGQLAAPSQVTVLFDSTPLSLATFDFPPGITPLTPQPPGGLSPAFIALAFAVVGLFFIGLVAVAGFTVLAQRRLRSLGMLSSLGATDKNIRLVMVANGAVVGVAGALAGAVIGLAAWIAYAPSFGVSADHRVVWTSLPWWLVVTAMILAVLTATLASRRPARAVAGVPVVAALSGRPVEPREGHDTPRLGLALLALGILLLAFSGGFGGSGSSSNLDAIGGLLATIAGLVLLAPIVIASLEPVARRAPVSARIALRDLARYRARSGAALAATSLAVLIAMFIALLATNRYTDGLDYVGPNLPHDQIIVYTPGNNAGASSARVLPTAKQDAAGRATAASIAAALGTRDVLALQTPVAPTDVALSRVGSAAQDTIDLYAATPALLRHYGIKPGAILPTTAVITSRPGLAGTSNLLLASGNWLSQNPTNIRNIPTPQIQTFASLPSDVSDPNLLVTEYAVRVLRMRVATVAWLIQAPRALTPLQVDSARRVAAAAGLTIETKNSQPSLDQVRNDAAAAGVLVALGVLAMTIGLIRSETAGDLRTLTATGASGRTRRNITGATAGALGLLGALLGTAVAYLAVFAYTWHEVILGEASLFPGPDLLLVLVGLPLLAAAGGWLFAGRQPPAIAHQPLE